MPPKKNDMTTSINPELYARSHKPASTIAMGLKGSQASSQSWSNQVRREDAIRATWTAKYDPTDDQDERATRALERTQARDAARHAAYVSPASNPEIHAILYRKAPPTAEATTGTGESMHTANADAPLPPSSSSSAYPASSSAVAAPVDDASSRNVRRAAAEYLEARCNHHTLQQRFPEGPVTASQGVGWGAATMAASGKSSCSSTAYASPNRRSAGAYRKPEDDDHAALLGFDYKPK